MKFPFLSSEKIEKRKPTVFFRLPGLFLLMLGLVIIMFSLKAIALNTFSDFSGVLITDWTRSYALYGQPHAIWLDGYRMVGVNLGKLDQVLLFAERQRHRPEIVIYTIPFRDLGQSSEGGFDTYENYLADNRLLAARIRQFIEKTRLIPRIYLEPDSLAHAVQYRREMQDNPKSLQVYQDRIRVLKMLVRLYKQTGALVYLDAAHSGWFDYNDEDIDAIADILNKAGFDETDGLLTNVSNRQKLVETGNPGSPAKERRYPQNEAHYLERLLPKLHHDGPLDVITDTSRNGGETHARLYYLELSGTAKEGKLFDNELPQGRWVGHWRQDETGEVWLLPFYGLPQKLSLLTSKDKYHYTPEKRILAAPPWLDPIGDVQPGPVPTDRTGLSKIQRFRYIKPPDDCDGSLNCPPGESKSRIIAETALFQETIPKRSNDFWDKLLK